MIDNNKVTEIMQQINCINHKLAQRENDNICETLYDDLRKGFITRAEYGKQFQVMFAKSDQLYEQLNEVEHKIIDLIKASRK